MKRAGSSAGRRVLAADRARVTDAIVRAYDAPFPDVTSKAEARAFPAMIPTQPDDAGARTMAETLAALPHRAPPTLVLWSDQDRVFPLEAGRRFAALFPRAEFRVVPGAGHFLPEEQGDRSGMAIAAFLPRLISQGRPDLPSPPRLAGPVASPGPLA